MDIFGKKRKIIACFLIKMTKNRILLMFISSNFSEKFLREKRVILQKVIEL